MRTLAIVLVSTLLLPALSHAQLTPQQAISVKQIRGISFSPNGKQIAFTLQQPPKGKEAEEDIWVATPAGAVSQLTRLGDAAMAQWSPDGAHLAYQREKPDEHQLMMWSADTRIEEPLASMSATGWQVVSDWSPDGKAILVSQGTDTHLFEVWLVPIADAPHAETAAKKIISSPTSNVYQAHFSPDGQWIAFETAADTPTGVDSAIYVTRAAGGPWVRLRQGKNWDDKPRWSPDGKTIYFISGRSGFFNVWGVHFNPATGILVGTPFPVTAFDQPSLMISQRIEGAELSVTQDRLALLMEETSGSIWMLENVEH